MILDLRVMDEKVRLWLGADDMDEDDRQALETVRDQWPDQQTGLVHRLQGCAFGVVQVTAGASRNRCRAPGWYRPSDPGRLAAQLTRASLDVGRATAPGGSPRSC